MIISNTRYKELLEDSKALKRIRALALKRQKRYLKTHKQVWVKRK